MLYAYANPTLYNMSEKGIELTELSWSIAKLWFDIEVLTREGSYQPEHHYKALILGKPLAEYRFVTDEELIKFREFLEDKEAMEMQQHGKN
jgi:hypothetical protein